MSNKNFSGSLAKYLEGLVMERKSLGYKFGEEEFHVHNAKKQ